MKVEDFFTIPRTLVRVKPLSAQIGGKSVGCWTTLENKQSKILFFQSVYQNATKYGPPHLSPLPRKPVKLYRTCFPLQTMTQVSLGRKGLHHSHGAPSTSSPSDGERTPGSSVIHGITLRKH